MAILLLQRANQAHLNGLERKALRLCLASLRCHPTAEAYTQLGWMYSLKGDLETAIALCQRAIITDPTLGNPYADLGAYLVELSRYDEARNCLSKALMARRYASLTGVHYNLGRIYEHVGEETKALAAYRQALALAPTDPTIQETCLRLLCRRN